MQMQLDGPTCGCGARGCLEALASRTAIERDIRAAVADGAKTAVTELTGGDLRAIKSGVLKRALLAGDPLVTGIITRAAETLARACVSLRHLLDPEAIILGGGVIEACEFFVLPIVERVFADDPLAGAGPGGRLVVSALGDDAVVLGALALAQQATGTDPLADATPDVPKYPAIAVARPGRVKVAGSTYTADLVVCADGKVKKRDKLLAKVGSASPGRIDWPELARVCRGGVDVLVVAAGHKPTAALTEQAEAFLRRRGVALELLPTPEAAEAYNQAPGRKAAIIVVS